MCEVIFARPLSADKIEPVIAHPKHLHPTMPELRKKLDEQIRHYGEDALRMRYGD